MGFIYNYCCLQSNKNGSEGKDSDVKGPNVDTLMGSGLAASAGPRKTVIGQRKTPSKVND